MYFLDLQEIPIMIKNVRKKITKRKMKRNEKNNAKHTLKELLSTQLFIIYPMQKLKNVWLIWIKVKSSSGHQVKEQII